MLIGRYVSGEKYIFGGLTVWEEMQKNNVDPSSSGQEARIFDIIEKYSQ